jgi:hypothetical protein
MSGYELQLGNRIEKDYGVYYKGRIETEDRVITGAYREPAGGSDTLYTLANGVLAGKDSMRAAAHVAAEEGYSTFAVDYSRYSSSTPEALESNAIDVAAAIDATPTDMVGEDLKRRAAGMSKGGRVLIKALAKAEQDTESATLVVPAGITDWQLSWVGGAVRLGATGREVVGMAFSDTREAIHIGGTCVKNALLHPLDTVRELGELKSGHEQGTLHEVRTRDNPPFLRLLYADGDLIVKARELKNTLPGLPRVFDQVVAYPGGHIDFAYCGEIARDYLYRQDKALFGGGYLTRPPQHDLDKAA